MLTVLQFQICAIQCPNFEPARETMASTISFNLKIDPRLLDIVDKEWKQDNLADDGELLGHSKH